jgi:hypothetical protein
MKSGGWRSRAATSSAQVALKRASPARLAARSSSPLKPKQAHRIVSKDPSVLLIREPELQNL